MTDGSNAGKVAGEKTSPYPSQGDAGKPQGGDLERTPDTTAPTRAPGVPAPQKGGPDAPSLPGQTPTKNG